MHLVKGAVPRPVRRYLRARHRDYTFWRALRRFSADPRSAIATQGSVLTDLIYGWGNPMWSALEEYLVGCLHYALIVEGPILECGSGLTTIVLGVIAQKRGNTVWSLEHLPEWGERVGKYLKKYQIASVRLCIKSLKEFGDFSWYCPPLDLMPEKFEMVVCDGPPGDTRGGRYGLLPVMRERLGAGTIILLDDGGREQEKAVARRWAGELNSNYEVLGSEKPYIRITVPSTR